MTANKNSVFVDIKTGKRYQYKGGKFVEIEGTSHSGENDEEEKKRISDEIRRQEEEERNRENAEQRSEEEEKERLANIDRMLNDPEEAAEAEAESEARVEYDRNKKKQAERERQRELQKYQNSQGIEGFKVSIEDFMARELAPEKVRSYKKLNKTYNSNVGPIIRRGSTVRKSGKIPKLLLYFDQSGSWTQSDVELGTRAIASLAEYEKEKLLKIQIKYFSNIVTTDQEEAREQGGTRAGKEVLEDIQREHPDNVVIMTDSDTDRVGETENGPSVTVPGGVWFLWKNGQKANKIKSKLRGRKLTKEFNISNH